MLPGVGMSELLLLAAAALIFIGPKDLPMLMRKLGQLLAKARRLASDFQAAFDDIARQSELEELKKEILELKRNNTLTRTQDDFAAAEADINAAVLAKHPQTDSERT